MRINVSRLLKEAVGSNRSYQLDETINADDINSVKGAVSLTRTKSGLIVKGEITADLTGTCSRCLKQVSYQVDYEFKEEALSTMDLPGSSYALAEPDSLTIDESQVLDLTEVIRQYTLLTMPAKLLCRPDCAGICPSCGHDLNQSLCQCSSKASDQQGLKLTRWV